MLPDMAELSPKEQLAFHEFSVRYRAAYAKKHPCPPQSLEVVREALWGEYEKEQEANRGPKIETPKIEPPTPAAGREPNEPDQDR
ncbi:MAG TPA: hypothetical protein VG347_24080 [Verrucomicrobiae bacterium]|nr:hypothetical protein [Verrucomicrobiae bacterium]